MSESKAASVVFTNSSYLAGQAQATAEKAQSTAGNAYELANDAQKTADGKNSIYRGSDPNTVPTAGLKEGDLYFTDNAIYTWTGSAWEKTVSDTTGAEIKAQVEQAVQESHKAVADLELNVESKVKELDTSIESTKTSLTATTNQIASDLSEAKNNLATVAHDLSETKSSMQSGLDAVNKDLSTTKSDLATVSKDLTTTKSDLADTGQRLETAVSDFQKKTDQLSGSLETANSKIEFNSKAISEVKQTADEISTTVSDHSGKISQLQQTASGLTSRVGDAEGNISQLQQDTSGLKSTVGDQSGKISQLQQTASRLTSRIGSAEGNISQLQQTASGLQSTVSNIRVGGRNLLTNTRTLSDVWHGATETVDGFTVAKATKTGGDYLDPLQWYGLTIIKPNTDYVLTFYAKASKQTTIRSHLYDIGPEGYYNDGLTTNTLTTDYQRFVVKFHTGAFPAGRWVNCIPVRLLDNVTAWIYGVQLEEGNTPTQWQPNPADTDQAISKVSQTAESIRADLTNTKGDVASVKAKADSLTSDMANAKGDISSLQQTASQLTVDMKDTKGNVSQLQQDARGLTSRVGSAEGNISQLQLTANGLNAYIKESNGSKTLASLLSMDPNNSTIAQVVNGKPIAAINMSSEGDVTIDGKKLHITASTTIDDASIKSSKIESLSADKITTGTLDASKIKVINLDANSITTGSFSAVLEEQRKFNTYTVSSSNPWDFNYTKSTYGNWFLIGETTADHIYNGPKDINNNRLTPNMYVTCRGTGNNFTVTVWKDYDPTQYQRIWSYDHWTDWVMLPNSQNLISAINLSPDSVKISGKNIELDGNTRVANGFTLSADKIESGTLNGVTITGSTFVAKSTNTTINDTYYSSYQVMIDNSGLAISAMDQFDSYFSAASWELSVYNNRSLGNRSITASLLGGTPHIELKGGDGGDDTQTRIDSHNIYSDNMQINEARIGPIHMSYHRIRSDSTLYLSNDSDTNFDSHGSVGLQVVAGLGIGRSTIYTPGTDLYVQNGNASPDGIGKPFSSAKKTQIHCQNVISQVANTVASRLSVKTNITPVSYDRALAAVEGTDMYDYQYINDDSGQHYVSGIIDDVHATPEYKMDDMLINKERTARIDANLIGYHHVIIKKLLERVDALEHQINKA